MASVVHFEAQPSSATPASGPPEVLQDLRKLREWYEEANRLELQIAQQSAKVAENDRHLVAARRQAAEGKARKARAAETIPKLERAMREVGNRSCAMSAALRTERENAVKRTKDNRGLRRSLQGLLRRLGETEEQAVSIEEEMRQEIELQEVARVEETTLMQTIEGMGEVRERLTKRVAAEREKRLRLREAARAKLERVEESQVFLKEQMDEHTAEVSAIKQRLSEQGERTLASQHALALAKENCRRANQYVEQQKEARAAMHSELLMVQRTHDGLRLDLETTLEKLEAILERDGKAKQCWRLQHMEQLDARIQAHRDLDQDRVVAEAEDSTSNARAGGC